MSNRTKRGRTWLAAPVLLAVSCTAVPSSPRCVGVSTSFEFTDTSGAFTLRESSASVTFTGGAAQRIGILSLYRTGFFAWMIDPGATGTITLNTPAEQVTLFFRNQSASDVSTVDVLDTEGNVIESFNGTTRFAEVSVTIDPAVDNPIGSVEVRSTAGTGQISVDDFSFCVVEPGKPATGRVAPFYSN